MPMSTSISGPYHRGLAFAFFLRCGSSWYRELFGFDRPLDFGMTRAWYRLRRPDREDRDGVGREPVGLRLAAEVQPDLVVPARRGRIAADPGRDDADAPFEVAEVPYDPPRGDHGRPVPLEPVEAALGHR